MSEHRSTQGGLYGRLQLPEHADAKVLLERWLESQETYETICEHLNRSELFIPIKRITPQDLSRYRARKAREDSRATTLALIESDADVMLDAATANPTGVIAKFLRKQLAQYAVAKFDAEVMELDPVDLSREAARHAKVEQVDRKLALDQEKLRLELKRIELQERAAELQRDRFGVAAEAWNFILAYLVRNEPSAADLLTARNEEILSGLEAHIQNV